MSGYRGKYNSYYSERKKEIRNNNRKQATVSKAIALSTLKSTEITNYGRIIFDNYEISKNGTLCAICNEKKPPVCKYDTLISGRYMLPSLYDLYLDINKEKVFKKKCEIIINWCKNNTFPYNINLLYSSCIDESARKFSKKIIEKLCIFKAKDFIHDLNWWGSRLELYFAIEDVIEYNKLDKVRNRLIIDGNYDYLKVIDEMNDNQAMDYIKTNQFLFYRTVTVNMPPIKIRSYYDDDNKFSLFPVCNSIFDIAYFALQRLICDVNFSIDNSNDVINKNSKMVLCPACHKHFFKKGKRQIYCTKPECQRERKKINKRNFDSRKKDKSNNN